MMNWKKNIFNFMSTLETLSVCDNAGHEVIPDSAFTEWQEFTLQIREHRKMVYLIGNGASASMASHTAADLAKNAFIHTEVFTDLSLMTAIANDISFEDVFAEPLRHRMIKGDMLVAISSSGESPNILRATREASKLGGFVVTLSAKRPDNTLRFQGTLNFYVCAQTYGMVESCHATILHHWMDLVLEEGKELLHPSQAKIIAMNEWDEKANRTPSPNQPAHTGMGESDRGAS